MSLFTKGVRANLFSDRITWWRITLPRVRLSWQHTQLKDGRTCWHLILARPARDPK
jgi:hypothetical protein